MANAICRWWCTAVVAMWLVPSLSQADEQSALESLKGLGATAKQDQQAEGQPVVQLAVRGRQITDDVLASVIELGKLQSLTITSASISDVGLKRLTALTELKSLSLSGCKVTDLGLADLASLTKLESLDLRGTLAFTSGQVTPLRLPTLKRLQISASNNLDLALLTELPALEELTIAGSAGRITLKAGLAQLKSLKKLTVVRLVFLPETALQGIDQLTSVREVDLTGIGWFLANSGHVLTERGVSKLKSLPNLQSLVLVGRSISDGGFETLGQLTQLQHLDLKGSNTSDADLMHLKLLKSLVGLNLTSTKVTEMGVIDLRSSMPSTTIDYLGPKESAESKLAKTQLGKVGGMFSASIRADTLQETVSSVILRGTQTTDDDLVHLQAFTELYGLDLSQTAVTDRGLEGLLTLRRLTSLKLNHTQITDMGIQKLSKLPNLRTLELVGLPITETGLKQLQQLQKLEKLTISSGRVSANCIDELKAALPKLNVTVQ